jgi:hypothetical protein
MVSIVAKPLVWLKVALGFAHLHFINAYYFAVCKPEFALLPRPSSNVSQQSCCNVEESD